jgi:hypothetical protein
MTDYGMGWRPSPPDERDWKPETLRAMVKLRVARPVAWAMPPGLWLSQGATQHCVGFLGAGFIAAEGSQAPIDTSVNDDLGHNLYYQAKVYDGEPLEEDGSCLRSLAKVLKYIGTIDAYALTSDFVACDQWVDTWGSVGLGIPWTEDMYHKDSNGVIHPTGSVAGGHAIMWRAKDQLFGNVLRNSWGEDWGECSIGDADLYNLLQEGEALLMVKLAAHYYPPASKPKTSLCHWGKGMKKRVVK